MFQLQIGFTIARDLLIMYDEASYTAYIWFCKIRF